MSGASVLFFPLFRIDLVNEKLWREGESVSLRRKTFAVLHHLVEHEGQLVTKDQLLDALWPGTYVVDTMPTLCIRELRKVLGDDARRPRFIETVHGRGYRFIAKVDSRREQRQRAKGKGQKLLSLRTQRSGLSTLFWWGATQSLRNCTAGWTRR